MKTKHLVAMALPLAFTACSQEELINENNQATTSERKVVENVVFKFNAEADSRMHFDEEYKWDAGDKFGACLMDQFITAMTGDFTWKKWFNQFELVDYLHTNYPFTRDENGSWSNAEAVMQEGNYFFYYPYNNNLGGQRTPIQLNVPTEQIVKDGQKTSSVLDYQMFVAYAPIVADPSKGNHETITNLTMEPLLAFPAFSITNNTGNAFTVKRIAIAGKDNGSSITFPTVFEVKPSKFNNIGFVTETTWSNKERRNEVIKTVVANKTDFETTSKVTLQYGEEGKALNNGDKYTSYIMLPSLNMLDNNSDGKLDGLKLYIYTDKGLVTVDLSRDDANDNNGDDVKLQNALTTYSYNDGHISYITLDERAFETPNEMDINSTKDLEDFIIWNTNSQKEIKANLSGNVEITNVIYDVLTKNDKLALSLSGKGVVTIPENAPKYAIDRIIFDSENINVINNAELAITKNKLLNVGSIINNGNITFTTALKTTAKTFTNNGIITFDKKGYELNVDITSIDNFSNYGEITINTTANVTATNANALINLGILTINEGAKYNGKFENRSMIDKTQKVVYGTINVNGTLSGQGSNEGTIIVDENGTIDATNVNNNVWNYNRAYYYPNGALIYQSTIENSGVVKGIYNNDGIVNMVTKNARYESKENSKGRINNTVLSPYVQKTSDEIIFVKITEDKNATEIANIVKASNAKELQISGTITIDKDVVVKGEEKELEVIAIGNLNFVGKEKSKISFIASDGEWLQNSSAKFTVNNGVTAKVVSGTIVDFGFGEVESNGKILVQSGAEFICGIDKPANAEVYGKWTNKNR